MLLVLALGTGGPSGCAGMYELKSLGNDRLDDGFSQVLLWRVRLVDHTGTLRGIPRFWLAIHKPEKELVAEIPSPDNWTSRTFEDGTSLYEATYTTESRAYPMDIETGTYTARSSTRTPMPLTGTRLWLLFAPPIAVASVPGQLTHLGILHIEITDLKGKEK